MDILLEKLKTRKFVLGLLVVAILIVAVPITVLQIQKQQTLKQNAAAPAVSLAFTPGTGNESTGTPFPVNVTMNTNGNNASAVDLQITYDQNLLTLNSFTPASTFSTITNNTTSVVGTIHYVGVNPTSTAISGSTVSIGTLNFTPKAAGTAAVSFGNIQVTAQGQSALLPLDTANIQPGSYKIGAGSGSSMMYLAISLPGIGADYTKENATPSATTRAFTYNIESPGYDAAQSGTLTYNTQAGAYDASIPVTVAPGLYNVKVKLPNTLAKLIPGVQIQSASACPTGANCTASIPAINSSGASLVNGDVVSDNIIDVKDYNALLKCYQSTCTAQEKQAADLNDDGVVDAKDLNILLRAFYTRNGD